MNMKTSVMPTWEMDMGPLWNSWIIPLVTHISDHVSTNIEPGARTEIGLGYVSHSGTKCNPALNPNGKLTWGHDGEQSHIGPIFG